MITSAGGVVYRRRPDDGVIEVKLITTKAWRFTLPKGRVEKGEDIADTAVREVKEEAGVKAEIETFLGKVEWKLQSGDKKVVHIYLMRAIKDGPVNDPDNEIINAEWKTLDEAIELVGFLPMRKMLINAIRYLDAEKAILCEHCFKSAAIFLEWCETCLTEAKRSLEKKKTKKYVKPKSKK